MPFDSDGAVRRVPAALARVRLRLFYDSRCGSAQREVVLALNRFKH